MRRSRTAEAKRQGFLAERKRGLGGSDMRDLFELPGQGCLRRLWYDKTGTPTDYPDEDSLLLRRGRILEDAAAAEYTLRTGRKLLRPSKPAVREDAPWARVNVDRRIQKAPRPGPASLEIKTKGASAFQRIKREGMKESEILQLQHALYVTGGPWGAFAVLHPDSWQMVYFDVERDEALIAAIRERGHAFWYGRLSGPPPAAPYKSSDPPCKSCAWRRTCHGEEASLELIVEPDALPLDQDDSLDEILADHAIAQAAADDAEATLTLIRQALRERLGHRTAVQCAAGRVYYGQQQRRQFDMKLFRATQPELAGSYEHIVTTRPLRVYTHRRSREE